MGKPFERESVGLEILSKRCMKQENKRSRKSLPALPP